MAALWRDLIVLLPRVRRAAAAGLPPQSGRLRAAVGEIELVSNGDALEIGVPDELVDHAGSETAFAQSLSGLKPIFAAVGLRPPEIRRRTVSRSTNRGAIPATPRALALVHCLSDPDKGPARRLRDARHLLASQLLAPGGTIDRASLPDLNSLLFLLVEDDDEQVRAATAIAKAAAERNGMIVALMLPQVEAIGPPRLYHQLKRSQRHSDLAAHCRWIAYAGEVVDYEDPEAPLPPVSNRHVEREIDDIGRWAAHALRACVTSGKPGVEALDALNRATAPHRKASISTAASRGDNAAAAAAKAALAASRRSNHPALTAELLILVAFHNRPLDSRTRDEIEHAARAWNAAARVLVVEEHREDMTKRARVVVFTTGRRQRVAREAYTPPARFMPLVRAGWSVGKNGRYAMPAIDTLRYRDCFYALRFEPDLVVSMDQVDAIIRSSAMHYGEVALLVGGIEDANSVERLLSSGIFCAKIGAPQSFDRFGNAPGAAILSAHAGLESAESCTRLSQLARHLALAGLWQLAPDWHMEGRGLHTQWAAGAYQREPQLEEFKRHRKMSDGTVYFRGVVRLDPARSDTPRLRYAFGLALEPAGARLTRMKTLEGEYDVRAAIRQRIDEQYFATYGRKRGERKTRAHADPDVGDRQFALPGLDDL